MNEEITAPLESWETVQKWWRNSEIKFDEYGSRGGIDSRSLSRPPGRLNGDVQLPKMFP